MGPGRSDYILGVIRTRYHWLQHSVCLGGGLRSPSAFLVTIVFITFSGTSDNNSLFFPFLKNTFSFFPPKCTFVTATREEKLN